jgi:MoxR-like ATPase
MTHGPLAALARSLRAGARALLLRSDDEARAVRLLEDLGTQLGCPVHTWSAATGCDASGTPTALTALLCDLAGRREPALWLLLDPPADPLAARALRELAQHPGPGPAALLLGEPAPTYAQIPELADHTLPPPELHELSELAVHEAEQLHRAGHHRAAAVLGDLSQGTSHSELPRLALGLSEHAARRLLREAALTGDGDPARTAAHLVTAKAEALHRGALLELAPPVPEDMLGGLHGLKTWLRRRALALDPAAHAAAIADPRGVLLVGVQGCGKSLAARVCAAILGLGLVRLDPGRLFGGTVGESEANLRRLTAAAERLAPVVLWIDELDKGLVGSEGAASDAGTAARVLGGLLTWLQERARPVFVVATANRVDTLPPELLRRGRLDEIFFVDLPGPDERAAILEIHLLHAPQRRLGRAPPLADPLAAYLAAARDADGLSGAELEGAVTEARLDAFAEARPLAAADLQRALAATIPLSRSRAIEVATLRAWASRFARPA